MFTNASALIFVGQLKQYVCEAKLRILAEDMREPSGALCCDRCCGRVFEGHNGAQSYYEAKAFRGVLRVWIWAAQQLTGVQLSLVRH
jgi:hypothetical protein